MVRLVFALSAALALSACAAEAGAPPDEPAALELTGRVVDAAEILTPAFEARLTDTLADLETDTKVQMIVATTPDLKGEDIADYSLALGNAWGIGDAQRNDGLMLVVAPNERRVRIEVGLGLEDTVTNKEAAQIIEKDILPYFRLGQFEKGVMKGVEGLSREIAPTELKEAA